MVSVGLKESGERGENVSATTKTKGRTTDRGRWGESTTMRDRCRDKESKEISSREHERTRERQSRCTERKRGKKRPQREFGGGGGQGQRQRQRRGEAKR